MSNAALISAARVRQAREEAHLSQFELAILIGCTPRTIQHWEAGPNGSRKNQQVHTRLVRGLAKATGRPVDWFFEEAVA